MLPRGLPAQTDVEFVSKRRHQSRFLETTTQFRTDLQVQCFIRTQAVQHGMQLAAIWREEKEFPPETLGVFSIVSGLGDVSIRVVVRGRGACLEESLV